MALQIHGSMKREKIHYRRTRYGDLVTATRLIVSTINNLYKRNGRPQVRIRFTRPWPMAAHWLGTDPEGTFVAVNEKGRIIGYVSALVREDEWYLADLFVRRSYQSSGVGQKLIQKAMNYGELRNCKRWALCTFGINEQAVAFYSKFGMTPQRPILELRRPLADGTKVVDMTPDIRLSCRELTDEKEINRLSRLDKKARGIRRPEEHFFWFRDPNSHVYLFHDRGRIAGYTVADANGRVGPVAATDPKYLRSLLYHSLNITRGEKMKMNQVHMVGENTELIPELLKAGFRVKQVLLEVATEKLGDPAIYIPGNLAHY